MSKTNSAGFPCREKGCTGVITNNPEFIVSVRVDDCSFSNAVACPKCGRLHWPGEGAPVRNQKFEKAFFIDGKTVHKPLVANEKLEAIDSLIADLVAETEDCGTSEHFHNEFGLLSRIGHATNCPANRGKDNCTCGQSKVLEWLAQHPPEKRGRVS